MTRGRPTPKELCQLVLHRLVYCVTPGLRAVDVYLTEKLLRVVAYFDGPLSELDEECLDDFGGQVLGDFIDDMESIGGVADFEVVRLDYPARMPIPETEDGVPWYDLPSPLPFWARVFARYEEVPPGEKRFHW